MKIIISRPPEYHKEESELSEFVDKWFEPTEDNGQFENQAETIAAMRLFIGKWVEVLAEKELLTPENIKDILGMTSGEDIQLKEQ